MLIGATNSLNGEKNKTLNVITQKMGTVPSTARYYQENKIKWIVIGDWNFGEGSSREHAALEIRHLGGMAVIVRSFARIHETNLKKQGVLPLTFLDPNDYDRIQPTDRIDILCAALAVGKTLTMKVRPVENRSYEVQLCHTFNKEQIDWFTMGSALNAMTSMNAKTSTT